MSKNEDGKNEDEETGKEYAENQIKLYNDDALERLDKMDASSVDVVITDPPYGLAFLDQDWDSFEPKEYQDWCKKWGEKVLRVLKPGGHLLSFSGNRTHHRLFTGLEDAGFEVRDTLTWHYSSGFPKAQDVGKNIDRWYSAEEIVEEREVCEWLREAIEESSKSFEDVAEHMDVTKAQVASHWACAPRHTQPQLPSQKQLGQILDFIEYDLEDAPDDIVSAFEKLRDQTGEYTDHWEEREVVGEKDGSISEAFGEETWASREGERLRESFKETKPKRKLSKKWEGWKTQLAPATEFILLAQKPISESAIYRNCLEHETGALHIDACRVGEDGGVTRKNVDNESDENEKLYGNGAYADHDTEELDDGRYPSNLILSDDVHDLFENKDKTKYFKSFKYNPKAQKKERTHDGEVENPHPTVKPKDVLSWLILMTTREDQVVLDPFMGSATTGLACVDTGRKFIGIERDADYFEICENRLEEYVDEPQTQIEDYTGSDTGNNSGAE